MFTSEFINDILKVIINAHEEILKIYNKDFEISYKNDKSPLTEADLISNKIICEFLKNNTDIPIISEENKDIDFQVRKDWELCFLVDPIDGTKEFIKKNGQFTTNIGLIKNGIPIYGFVGVPVEKKIYFGGEYYNSFCYEYSKNKITEIKPQKNNPLKIVASNSHMNDATKNFIKNYPNANIVNYGSSLKIIKLACGDADLYPRLAPTMEWDTAAADAILRGVGGILINHENNQPLKYNKENLLNPYFIGYNFEKS
jgi:3'(2'), 5'-bisphosphate nucleotidase